MRLVVLIIGVMLYAAGIGNAMEREWQVGTCGQDRTIHWQPLEGIIVTSEDDRAEDGFNYFLNNTDNDEGVLARLRSAP